MHGEERWPSHIIELHSSVSDEELVILLLFEVVGWASFEFILVSRRIPLLYSVPITVDVC